MPRTDKQTDYKLPEEGYDSLFLLEKMRAFYHP